jgi:RNA polymerase sigma factor (sigma-70 family)
MSKTEWPKQVAAWADAWHDDLVRFLARRTSTQADAQDLAQEVYLRLLRVDRTDLVRRPRSYLLRIAANALDDWRLQARQTRPHDSAALDTLESADDPERTAIAQSRAKYLSAEVLRLPGHVRVALVLQIREGLSYEQIAAEMNVSVRMVKRYLLAAYTKLRARLPSDL